MIWRAYQRSGVFACTFAVIGSLCAVGQNELIIRHTFPEDMVINILKAVNSGCSFVTVILIIRLYWLSILLTRMSDHIDRGLVLDASIGITGQQLLIPWTPHGHAF